MTQSYPKPPPAGSYTPAWVRGQQLFGGAFGDDLTTSTATLVTDQVPANGPVTAVDYAPRTQVAKAALVGMPIATDVGRARGSIAPNQPYPSAGDAPLTAPTITSLSPNTAVTGANKPTVAVTITGTGFTPWSSVTSGNFPIPCRFLTATTLEIIQKPSASVPGVVSVVVTDHGVASAGSNFTFT
jgi:hypothetical protein